MIPYAKHSISAADVAAVVRVLESGCITQGSQVPSFEQNICRLVNVKHAIAVNSATSALHLACLALGLGRNDYLWTSPISFVASANCALYCGANVDFVDIDPETYNICPTSLATKLGIASRNGRLPKVVVPVHFAGQSCDMERISALSREYGFKILEDASHAIGGQRSGVPIGSCKYSDATVFSFHPAKIITTGEGGMVTTNCESTASKVRLLRTHGITRNLNKDTAREIEGWYYQQLDLGFNYRLTDIQAALGNSQLSSLEVFLKARQTIVDRYNSELLSVPITLPFLDPHSLSANHLYVVKIKACTDITRSQLYEHLTNDGIFVNVHYIPIPAHPFYKSLGFNPNDYPIAMEYYQNAISLPLYPSLTESEQTFVLESIKRAFRCG